MIVALRLPLKVTTIIPRYIFSMLFNNFRVCDPMSTPTPLIVALTGFLHADADAHAHINIHLLPVLWYLISSLWMYMCSCMHIKSMLWSIAATVSSGSWPILFNVLTLNVAIYIVPLHFSSFWFSLSSVADFFNTRLQPQQNAPLFLLKRRAMPFGQVVWLWIMLIFRWLNFYSHL